MNNGDLKSAILDSDDIEYREITRELWGQTGLRVKMLDGDEREKFEAECLQSKDNSGSDVPQNVRARLVAYTLCGPDGKRIFTNKDIPRLTKKSARYLDVVFEESSKLNELDSSYVQELAKNSDAAPDGGSSSGSA